MTHSGVPTFSGPSDVIGPILFECYRSLMRASMLMLDLAAKRKAEGLEL
ncbi:MAG: hypothetical protein AAFY88_08875 [Acidobacteriota bacterium]